MRGGKHVLSPTSALCCATVTHDRLRALLPRYAAGELDEDQAELVRAHMASGCATCLGDVFSRPVGLPPVAVPPPRSVPRRTWPAVLAGLLAAGVAAGGVWAIGDLRGREARRSAELGAAAARLEELRARQAEQANRITALGHELETAHAEAARQTQAAREAAERSATLARDMEAAETRIATLERGVRRRDREIDRLLGAVDAQSLLHELVASPAVDFVRLRPILPFRDVRGHVLWQYAQREGVLHAFALPSPAPGGSYRVQLVLRDGRRVPGATFTPDAAGNAVLPLRLFGARDVLREIEIVLDPGTQPVLAGRADGPTG
jgi:hypothetical protein